MDNNMSRSAYEPTQNDQEVNPVTLPDKVIEFFSDTLKLLIAGLAEPLL